MSSAAVEEHAVPDNWKNAFAACQTESAGIVKSTNKVTIKLKQNESITLSGMVRNCRQIVSAVTETAKGVSSRIGVCPWLGCQAGSKRKEPESASQNIQCFCKRSSD